MDNNMLLKVMDDTDGNPVEFDLKMHGNLLLCGDNESGRVVLLYSLIHQLSYRMRSSDIRFVMADIDVRTLECYEDLPQLQMPILTEPIECARMLYWLVREMEARYELFRRFEVSSVDEFNALSFATKCAEYDSSDEMPVPKHMPRLVFVIDDLLMNASMGQQYLVHVLALLNGRSAKAGIHLIFSLSRESESTLDTLLAYGFGWRVCCSFTGTPDELNPENLPTEQTVNVGVSAQGMEHEQTGIFSFNKINIMQWVHGVANNSRVLESFVNESGIVSAVLVSGYLNGDEDIDELKGMTAGDRDVTDELLYAAVLLIHRIKMASIPTIRLNLGLSYRKTIAVLDRLEDLKLVSHKYGEPRNTNPDLIVQYIRNKKPN